jgi:hypothetical protein
LKIERVVDRLMISLRNFRHVCHGPLPPVA